MHQKVEHNQGDGVAGEEVSPAHGAGQSLGPSPQPDNADQFVDTVVSAVQSQQVAIVESFSGMKTAKNQSETDK